MRLDSTRDWIYLLTFATSLTSSLFLIKSPSFTSNAADPWSGLSHGRVHFLARGGSYLLEWTNPQCYIGNFHFKCFFNWSCDLYSPKKWQFDIELEFTEASCANCWFNTPIHHTRWVRFYFIDHSGSHPYGTHIHHSLVISKGVFTIIFLLNTKKHMYKYKVCKSKDTQWKKPRYTSFTLVVAAICHAHKLGLIQAARSLGLATGHDEGMLLWQPGCAASCHPRTDREESIV